MEEGLIVEVRPGLEKDGLRVVTVRARAAKLKSIEDKVYPNATVDAVIQLPEWFALSDLDDGPYLASGEAILLPLDLPGSDGRKIVVMVAIKKVQ